MPEPKVSAIVLNWNGAALIRSCLASLYAQDYPDLELILIDNASTDGSSAIISESPASTVLQNDKNIGFSQAMNAGIRRSTGDFILTLNYDIILEPDFISTLIKTAQQDRMIGSVSGKLLRLTASGDKSTIIDSTGHVLFRNRLAVNRGEEQEDEGQYSKTEEIFGACGAAALYRRAMFEDVRTGDEYFDEDFFAFWEDVDLDWRARLRGWKCVYTPEAVAYHERGGPKRRRSETVEYHNYKNRLLMMMKDDDPKSLFKAVIPLALTELLKFGALALRCPSALKSLGEVWRLRRRMLEKRRQIQSTRTVPTAEIEAWMQPFNYISWIKRNLLSR